MTSVKIILVKKNGDIILKNIKSTKELYKKAGFRSDNNFDLRHTYQVENSYYQIYSKNKGRANTENKYELPPPLDNDLYFGSILIIKLNNDKECVDITEEEWNKVYEKLFGGFEDLNTENEQSENDEEDDIYNDLERTAQGYAKDGFVISDNDELDEEEYVDE